MAGSLSGPGVAMRRERPARGAKGVRTPGHLCPPPWRSSAEKGALTTSTRLVRPPTRRARRGQRGRRRTASCRGASLPNVIHWGWRGAPAPSNPDRRERSPGLPITPPLPSPSPMTEASMAREGTAPGVMRRFAKAFDHNGEEMPSERKALGWLKSRATDVRHRSFALVFSGPFLMLVGNKPVVRFESEGFTGPIRRRRGWLLEYSVLCLSK